MNSETIRIETPGGRVLERSRPDAAGGLSLLEWLEKNRIPINSRCGGRGLCRGCQVDIEKGEASMTLRSCQVAWDRLPSGPVRLRVPASSWRDDSLHGVSAFEIRAEYGVPATRPGIGLAMDIGTTTVAAALWDFTSGQCLGSGSRTNAQIRYGDNVVARIDYSTNKPDGIKDLKNALVADSLCPLIDKLCRNARVRIDDVTEANAAGNPAMLHALAGASLEGLGSYPFRPAFLDMRSFASAAIRLQGRFPVKFLPCLGPFVGADIVAGALAAGLMNLKNPALLIDFGTNGEILLRTQEGYLATATAAGPAFEGGRLNCGAAALV